MENHWYDQGNDPQTAMLATMETTLPETEEYASEVQDDIGRAVDLLRKLESDLVLKDLYDLADNAGQIHGMLVDTPAHDVVKLLRLLT